MEFYKQPNKPQPPPGRGLETAVNRSAISRQIDRGCTVATGSEPREVRSLQSSTQDPGEDALFIEKAISDFFGDYRRTSRIIRNTSLCRHLADVPHTNTCARALLSGNSVLG